MAKLIVALFALAFHLCATAQTVGLHLVSAHQHGGLNGINPGVYVRFGNGATVGTFRNSYKRQSAYAAWTFETGHAAGLSAAVTIGAITGYPAAKVMPMLAPSVAFNFGASAVRLALVPKPPRHGTSAGLHLMVEHGF